MYQIDLFLGSDIGLWVLEQISPSSVGQIFTLDESIAIAARNFGKEVWLENANSVEFSPSQYGFSIHYPRILKPNLIAKYRKIYNLHPGLLPWGRGYYPVFWALWENTPAGATLHEITAGIDEGPIVDQVQVEYYCFDTGASLLQRVREAEKEIFLKYWFQISMGKEPPSYPQAVGGTYHTKKEFLDLKRRSEWESMNGKDLVRLIRSLTFPGYTGLEVTLGQKKFHVYLEELNKN